MDSTITIVGNTTREPELRFTTGGRANASFGVAVSRRYQQNNEWQEQTSFFNVVCWGTLAENVAATISKGHRVVVTGRLEQRSYDDLSVTYYNGEALPPLGSIASVDVWVGGGDES